MHRGYPSEPDNAPSAQTFDSVDEFLSAIKPGMELCTSDFTGWASVTSVRTATDEHPGSVSGKRREYGALVEIPANALLDIRGGHCVRIDRVRATINAQGWEVNISESSRS